MGVESGQNEGDELSGVRRPPDAGVEEFQLEGYEDLALNLHQCRVAGRCVEDLARQVGKYGIPGGYGRVARIPAPASFRSSSPSPCAKAPISAHPCRP